MVYWSNIPIFLRLLHNFGRQNCRRWIEWWKQLPRWSAPIEIYLQCVALRDFVLNIWMTEVVFSDLQYKRLLYCPCQKSNWKSSRRIKTFVARQFRISTIVSLLFSDPYQCVIFQLNGIRHANDHYTSNDDICVQSPRANDVNEFDYTQISFLIIPIVSRDLHRVPIHSDVNQCVTVSPLKETFGGQHTMYDRYNEFMCVMFHG